MGEAMTAAENSNTDESKEIALQSQQRRNELTNNIFTHLLHCLPSSPNYPAINKKKSFLTIPNNSSWSRNDVVEEESSDDNVEEFVNFGSHVIGSEKAENIVRNEISSSKTFWMDDLLQGYLPKFIEYCRDSTSNKIMSTVREKVQYAHWKINDKEIDEEEIEKIMSPLSNLLNICLRCGVDLSDEESICKKYQQELQFWDISSAENLIDLIKDLIFQKLEWLMQDSIPTERRQSILGSTSHEFKFTQDVVFPKEFVCQLFRFVKSKPENFKMESFLVLNVQENKFQYVEGISRAMFVKWLQPSSNKEEHNISEDICRKLFFFPIDANSSETFKKPLLENVDDFSFQERFQSIIIRQYPFALSYLLNKMTASYCARKSYKLFRTSISNLQKTMYSWISPRHVLYFSEKPVQKGEKVTRPRSESTNDVIRSKLVSDLEEALYDTTKTEMLDIYLKEIRYGGEMEMFEDSSVSQGPSFASQKKCFKQHIACIEDSSKWLCIDSNNDSLHSEVDDVSNEDHRKIKSEFTYRLIPQSPHLQLNKNVATHSLCDLHTHLLGMGSHQFWLESVMCTFIPTMKDEYSATLKMRLLNICHRCNINASHCKTVKDFLILLENKLYSKNLFAYQIPAASPCKTPKPRTGSFDEQSKYKNQVHDEKEEPEQLDLFILKDIDLLGFLNEENITAVLHQLTIDVVYSKKILLAALFGHDSSSPNSTLDEEDHIRNIEKALSNSSLPYSFNENFRRYLIFNVKEGKFEWVEGVTNTYLLQVMEWYKRADDRSDKANSIIARLRNCFSMLNCDGSSATPADLDNYRGNFTPCFYPMRYLLKDAIYHQYPFVLSYLLNRVCYRYLKSGVGYIEFSVGVNDLGNTRINEWLHPQKALYAKAYRNNSLYDVEDYTIDNEFVRYAVSWHTFSVEDHIRYRFLIAFPRGITCVSKLPNHIRRKFVILFGPHYCNKIKQHCAQDIDKFVENLYSASQIETWDNKLGKIWEAVQGNMNGLSTATTSNAISTDDDTMQYLDTLNEATDTTYCVERLFVGFDIVGDEDGNPFSPFVHSKFQNRLRQFKKQFPLFGIRFHAGENVAKKSSVDIDHKTDELQLNFHTHMNVLITEIEYLAENICKLPMHEDQYSIRIGHGLAFAREIAPHYGSINALHVLTFCKELDEHLPCGKLSIFCEDMGIVNPWTDWLSIDTNELERFRKQYLQTHKIAFEVSLTSNNTLLSDLYCMEIGHADGRLALREMLKNDFYVLLSTDDDGIWPIRKCKRHQSHVSVANEYCRSITMLENKKYPSTYQLYKLFRRPKDIHQVLMNNIHSMNMNSTQDWERLFHTFNNHLRVPFKHENAQQQFRQKFQRLFKSLTIALPDYESLNRLLMPLMNHSSKWFSRPNYYPPPPTATPLPTPPGVGAGAATTSTISLPPAIQTKFSEDEEEYTI